MSFIEYYQMFFFGDIINEKHLFTFFKVEQDQVHV